MLCQEKVFYCSNSSGSFQVKAKNLETNEIESITANEQFNYWWSEPSPDGTKLLLMRSPVGEDVNNMFDYDSCQMIISNIDGSNEEILLDYQAYNWNAFGNPHWHPLGDRIILLAQPTNEFFIYTMDIEGLNPKQLTTAFSIDPHWSHSGDKIVFIGINADPTPFPSFDDFEVFTADYDIGQNSLSNIQQLTDDTRRDHDPCFSPDDSQIAFSSASNINLSVAHLTLIDLQGNNRIDLVNDETTNGGPLNWGSDGKIYYHNVNFNFIPFSPFTAKSFEVSTSTNFDLFPSVSEGYISPFYFNNQIVEVDELHKEQAQVVIYPNPSNGILFVDSPDQSSKTIKVFSSEGKRLLEESFNQSKELDISAFKEGVLFYQIITEGDTQAGVLIKTN